MSWCDLFDKRRELMDEWAQTFCYMLILTSIPEKAAVSKLEPTRYHKWSGGTQIKVP
jgi:hypothetical protein